MKRSKAFSSSLRGEEVKRLMERRPTATPAQRIYDDFVPSHDVVQGKEEETFVIALPGFKREHIKIQINNFGKLKISGERCLVNNRWSHFLKEFQVPDYCNASEIGAKFENGFLYIILPKFISEYSTKDETPKTALDRKGTMETKVDGSKNDTSQKTNLRPEESDSSSKKQLDEEESIDASKDAQKVEEKEKDQTKEPEHAEEVVSDAEHEKGGNGIQMIETRKKKAVTQEEATSAGHGNMPGNLKNVRRLRSGLYRCRQLILNAVLILMVLVGLGLYVTYKLKESMPIDSYETELGGSISS